MTADRSTKAVTKSVRFSPEETALIEEISRREHLPEGTLMRKLVLDGLARLRLERAVSGYQSGELNLGEAAHAAGVSVRVFLSELDRRGIDLARDGDVASSLQNLLRLFGGSPEFAATVADLTARDRTTGA